MSIEVHFLPCRKARPESMSSMSTKTSESRRGSGLDKLTSVAPVVALDLCAQGISNLAMPARELIAPTCAIDGMFPAPNAAALPGSTAKSTAKARSQVPRGSSGNDDMTQPYRGGWRDARGEVGEYEQVKTGERRKKYEQLSHSQRPGAGDAA